MKIKTSSSAVSGRGPISSSSPAVFSGGSTIRAIARVLTVCLSTFFFAMAFTANADACSCAASSEAKKFSLASSVFEGIPVSSRAVENPKVWWMSVEYSFKVLGSSKGPTNDVAKVYTSRGGRDCGYPFQLGEKYRVYGEFRKGLLYTGLCSGTKLMGNFQADTLRQKAEDRLISRIYSGILREGQKYEGLRNLKFPEGLAPRSIHYEKGVQRMANPNYAEELKAFEKIVHASPQIAIGPPSKDFTKLTPAGVSIHIEILSSVYVDPSGSRVVTTYKPSKYPRQFSRANGDEIGLAIAADLGDVTKKELFQKRIREIVAQEVETYFDELNSTNSPGNVTTTPQAGAGW